MQPSVADRVIDAMRAALVASLITSCTPSAPAPRATGDLATKSAAPVPAPTAPTAVAAPATPVTRVDARPVIDDPLLVLGDPRMRAYSYGAIAIDATRTRLAITEGSWIRVWNLPAKTLAFAVPIGGGFPQFVGEYLAVLPTHADAVRWWNASGREVSAPYPECTWQIASNTTGSVVACAAKSPVRVRVFGATNATLAFDDLTDDERSIDAVTISPDGRWLAATTGYRVHGFDLATRKRVWVRPHHARDCFAFDHAGHLILGDSDLHRTNTTIFVVDATSGTELAKRRFESYIEKCDASPANDAMLLVDPTTHSTRVLALPTLEPRDVLPTTLPQRDAAFSVDGRSIYAQNADHVIEWQRDVKQWAPTIGHLGNATALALSPDGTTVASVGTDGRLVLWPLDGGASRTLREGLDFALTSVAFSLDGKRVAIGSAADTFPDLAGTPDGKGVVEVWDIATGKRVFRVKRGTDDIVTLGFAKKRLFALDGDSVLYELDANTGALRSRRELVEGFGRIAGGVEVLDAAFDVDATAVMAWLAAGRDSAFVAMTMRGKTIAEGTPFVAPPRAAGFAPDGRLWTCADEDCVPTDEHGDVVPVIPVVHTYLQDGPKAIAPTRTKQHAISNHRPGSRCHAFHPDGKRFIACSPDGLVRVWDLERL